MVGYNSSKYDLNIIKKYFITHIGAEKQVTVAKKQGRIMFLSTPFQPQISSFWTFVIIWGQARVMRGGWKCMEAARQNHGCHMSGLTVLTDYIMMACRWIVVGSQNWKTSLSCCWRSMRTASRCSGSREWEHLTVGWSITTIWMSAPSWMHKKKGEDFTQGFVSTCDDAVSLLGVSLQYLLRGMLQGRNLSELYAPEKEAYEMQKGAAVGGPSLVFTRKHEVRKTTTAPPHKSRTTRVRVKRLFVMTLTHCTGVLFWKKCLVGQERWLTTKIQPKLGGFKSRLYRKVWFGSAEVDIHVPRELWTKFEEFPPLFYNSYIPSKAIATHMKEYLQWTKRAGIQTEKLCERLTGKKILLYAPLLEWYLKHGVEITDWTTDHRPPKILTWFINEVTENRRRGGEDPDIAFLADVLKLLGNSAYGKLMKAKERQTRVIYTKDQHVVNQAKWSAWFDDLEEIGDVFKIVLKGESDDQQAVPGGNHRVSTGQLAKLRMLQFYYDCLDHFIDRRDFKLIQMDTDSTYLMQNARRSRLPRGSWRVPSDKNELVHMGQMEQLHTVSVG